MMKILKFLIFIALGIILFVFPGFVTPLSNDINTCLKESKLQIDKIRKRDLKVWCEQIKQYSIRHYNEPTWELKPSVIVLHYTVSDGFPWNLVTSTEFKGETPGLAVHYVVEKTKIWEILPTDIRSRGAYGINHKAINIEMVAMNAKDLYTKKDTLDTTAQLVSCLMKNFNIPINNIYSHSDVSKMNTKIVPEVKDLIDSKPYGKIDPGEENMKYIKDKLKNIK